MNKKIKELSIRLEVAELEANHVITDLKDKLQVEYEKVFEKDSDIKKCINKLEESNHFLLLEDGLYLTQDIEFNIDDDSKEYLINYFSDRGYILNEDIRCLMSYCGDDFIYIQNDTRNSNGVWQYHKLIINEKEYLNEYGEVDESKRNKLIEEYMEKDKCFPYVGIITRYGDFYSVNTKADKT